MPNRMPAEHALCRSRGFTLIELVVTVAVIALGVSLAAIALRDSAASALERDAARLAALLESARALSRAWGIPLYGVSSLEALALGGAMRGLDDILAVIDARRRELFVLRARRLGSDDVAVVSGPEIAARADLHAGPETAIVTPNPDLCPELDGAVAVECRPEHLARRALALLARKEAGEDVRLDTEPQYLRRPDVHGA